LGGRLGQQRLLQVGDFLLEFVDFRRICIDFLLGLFGAEIVD
jgi:hypothetical protein